MKNLQHNMKHKKWIQKQRRDKAKTRLAVEKNGIVHLYCHVKVWMKHRCYLHNSSSLWGRTTNGETSST